LAAIQAACNRDDVMVACRATGSATLQLLAQAPRTDVFFNTGDMNNTLHVGNGTNWYFSTGYSMGFVGLADTVSRNSCDTGAANAGTRLCFHTGGGNINGGYRCGADLGLNGSGAFERVLYHRSRYRPVGPQNAVPVATVTSGGWTECYRDLFSNTGTPMATIQAQCSGPDIMVACRPTGSATLQLLAQAPRADVFFDTGMGNVLHVANGSGWYYNNAWSFGYTTAAETVNRNSCDVNNTTPASRFCAHTGGGNINGGYRCGADAGLNGSAAFERIIYHTAPATTFRVTSMSLNMCTQSDNEEAMGAGDQRGILAVTNTTVLYSGDTSTVYMPLNIPAANGITAVGRIHDAMVSNLRTGVGYFFANAMGTEPTSGSAGNVTQLIQMTDQGAATATAIPLSIPIPLTGGGLGFYSGYGRVIVYTGAVNGWYNVDLPSGTTTQINGAAPTNPNGCESWAHSGVAEYIGGQPSVVFMANNGVVRQRISDGVQTVISMNVGGDVCSISISPTANRWYSQYEGAPAYVPQLAGEHVVQCPATWDQP